MAKEQMDSKYLKQANALDDEFFDIVDKDLPNQHRVLKAQKSIDVFMQKHTDLVKSHEAELIAHGFLEAPTPLEPQRDPLILIDELTAILKQKGILS